MRRQRYTVTMTNGDRQVVLAYGPNGAHNFYAEQGYNIERVTKGDYRMPRAPRPPDGDWNFNLPAINAAFEAMTGQSLPATLKFVKGRHAARQEGVFEAYIWEQTIRICRTLSAAAANVAIWHELAHVAQWLRADGHLAWIQQTKAESKARYGYYDRPTEREAREWEALAETDWLLDGERR